jgi:predicted ABC-type ATPase
MRLNNPQCNIIAGANGTGKTTFATEFLPHYAHCTNFVNPDMIAHGLSPFNPDAAMIRAGRIVLEQIAAFERARVDFAFETTLSGVTYIAVLKRLHSSGYRINMYYLWVPEVDLALSRIRDRVRNGGHNVSESDVRRRFDKTVRNLFVLYRPLLDTLHFFDNSGNAPVLIFKYDEEGHSVYDKNLSRQLMEKYGNIESN